MENLWTSLIQVSVAYFRKLIKVIPLTSPIQIFAMGNCGYSNVPPADQFPGVSNSDFQLYVAKANNQAGLRWLDAVVCHRISNVPRAGGFTFYMYPAAFWTDTPTNYEYNKYL
jgi:hypothetical protein